MSESFVGLEGSWQMIRAEFAGDAMPALAAEKTTLQLSATGYAILFAGEIMDAGKITARPAGAHATLLFLGERGSNRGRIIPAIYQRVGDRLRICFGIDGQIPPAFSTSAGAQRYLATYRRSHD